MAIFWSFGFWLCACVCFSMCFVFTSLCHLSAHFVILQFISMCPGFCCHDSRSPPISYLVCFLFCQFPYLSSHLFLVIAPLVSCSPLSYLPKLVCVLFLFWQIKCLLKVSVWVLIFLILTVVRLNLQMTPMELDWIGE